MLLDTHFHLNFLQDVQAQQTLLDELASRNVSIIAQTMLPSEALELVGSAYLAGSARAVGFHPWAIESVALAQQELKNFEQALATRSSVGEVGLDFSDRGLSYASAELQISVFDRIIELCRKLVVSEQKKLILSIHSVQSAEKILEILEKTGGLTPQKVGRGSGIIPVFHWFSDGGAQLTRAVQLGAYFSVNSRMLATKRGKAYARQIPADRILLESDLPSRQRLTELPAHENPATLLANELEQELNLTLATLCELRGQDMRPQILANQQKIYGI